MFIGAVDSDGRTFGVDDGYLEFENGQGFNQTPTAFSVLLTLIVKEFVCSHITTSPVP